MLRAMVQVSCQAHLLSNLARNNMEVRPKKQKSRNVLWMDEIFLGTT